MIKAIYHRFFNGVQRQDGWEDTNTVWDALRRDVDPDIPYRALLSPRAMAILRAVAEALFDDHSGGPPADRLDWFERELNDLFASADGPSSLLLRVAPWVLEFSPVLTLSHLSLLTQLTRPEQQRCLERLERSPLPPLGLIFLLCKALICLIYLEHPEALSEIGFDGGCKVGSRPDLPLGRVFSV